MKSIVFGSLLFLVGCTGTIPPQEVPNQDGACNEIYQPVCAEVQIQCITTPCNPIQETISNVCEAEKRGLKVLYEGECQIEPEMPAGNFEFNEYGNFYGEVYVKGYVQVESIPAAFCEEPCETRFNGVFLHVIETGNENFGEFLLKNKGNAYMGEPDDEGFGQIMLGCIEDEKLTYANDSDEHGMAEQTWTTEQTQSLLNHDSPEKSGIVKLTKLQLSGGRGAPSCYSHFYGIELIK